MSYLLSRFLLSLLISCLFLWMVFACYCSYCFNLMILWSSCNPFPCIFFFLFSRYFSIISSIFPPNYFSCPFNLWCCSISFRFLPLIDMIRLTAVWSFWWNIFFISFYLHCNMFLLRLLFIIVITLVHVLFIVVILELTFSHNLYISMYDYNNKLEFIRRNNFIYNPTLNIISFKIFQWKYFSLLLLH